MLSGKQVAVVIPVYNEGAVVQSVISALPAFVDKVFVVDDGSDVPVSHSLPINNKVTVLRHLVNRGAGAATATGITAALSTPADIIVTLDGDGQHDPTDVDELIAPLLNGAADVVVGSRFLADYASMPYLKRLGNHVLNTVTLLLYGFSCSDTQSGFKAFSRNAAQAITISIDRYGFCSEIIGEIKRHNLRLSEVLVSTRYINKSGGTNIFDGIEIFLDLVVERFRK